jgi:hypothetical protein
VQGMSTCVQRNILRLLALRIQEPGHKGREFAHPALPISE